ncbi:MAG: cytochrome c [Verrucomicrobiota bacterium]
MDQDVEPTVEKSPAPVWPIVLAMLLAYFGAVYFDLHRGWSDKRVYAPYSSAEDLARFQPQSSEAAILAHSRAVYESVCGVCHGSDGLGKPNQFPPLAGSEWVCKDVENLVRVPQLGLAGSIQVSGQTWKLAMPPMGANLSDEDLAGVLSYIRQSWGNHGATVSADDVKASRAAIISNEVR